MDHEAPLKPTKPVSSKANFKSFATKIVIVLGVLVSVYAVGNYLMAANAPEKPTSLSDMDGSKDKPDVPQDGSSDKTIKPPKDEDEESEKNPEHGHLKTDSGGDGREPPNNNHWNTVYRGNVNSGYGVAPVKEKEADVVQVVDGERTATNNRAQSETDKQKSSTDETDTDEDKIDEYDILRGPDFRGVDPRASDIGSIRP